MTKKTIFTILTILILPILAFWVVSSAKQDVALANSNGKPAIIKFSSTMCLECKQVEKVFKEIMPKYKDKITYTEVIVDNRNDMNNKLIEKYNVSLVPTIIMLNSDGTQSKRIESALPKEQMEQCIKELK